MNKKIIAAAVAAAVYMPVVAHAGDYADKYFSKDELPMTPSDREAIQMSKQWQSGQYAAGPQRGSDAAVMFRFGSSQPTIVCAVLQVCDVALQSGETVNTVNLGDKVRWDVSPAVTGSGSNEVQHVIIKPLDVGLETSLIVTTDRRTYHLRLQSTRHDYMPSVAFSYPDEMAREWQALAQKKQQEVTRNTLPATHEYLGNLDFGYDISGNARWKPTRVYNDGVKTIIEMPSVLSQDEAPTLLVVRKRGGLFHKEKTSVVNYRVQDGRYIVDSVFSQAILISGVGGDQERVTLTHTGDGGSPGSAPTTQNVSYSSN